MSCNNCQIKDCGVLQVKCSLCDTSFKPSEDQILLMAWGDPNIVEGYPEPVCRECYGIWSDGK